MAKAELQALVERGSVVDVDTEQVSDIANIMDTSDFVFDKHTLKLKGFLDLGEFVETDLSTLGRETDTLASPNYG